MPVNDVRGLASFVSVKGRNGLYVYPYYDVGTNTLITTKSNNNYNNKTNTTLAFARQSQMSKFRFSVNQRGAED